MSSWIEIDVLNPSVNMRNNIHKLYVDRKPLIKQIHESKALYCKRNPATFWHI